MWNLGQGLPFEKRQKRVRIGDEDYYIDLVFFHRGLRCSVLIDLKIGKFTHVDVGQMNMYLNYWRETERFDSENDPIGIVLCKDKDESVIRYALGGMSQHIFVPQYQFKLPSEEELQNALHRFDETQGEVNEHKN